MKHQRTRQTRHYASLILLFSAFLISVQAQTINMLSWSDHPNGGIAYAPSLAVGDVNNDGRPDLVATNRALPNDFIGVYLNDGAGTFSFTPLQAGSALSARVVTLGDFNSDGNLDMAIGTDFLTGGLNIRLGNGTGNFPTGNSFGTSTTIESISDMATADFNGDGKLDLAITKVGGYNTAPSNAVKLLLGDGLGGFGSPASFAVQFGAAQDIEIADFNVDGRPDIVATAPNSNVVQILLNNGSGGFNTAVNTTANGAQKMASADFNRDCIPDLAVTRSSTGNQVYILLGNGTGGFSSTTIAVTNQPDGIAVGDFNRDKKVDIAIRRISSTAGVPNFTILPGNGSGGFGTAFELTLSASASAASSLGVLDVDRDGKDDIVINRQGGFALYHGNSAMFTSTENDFDGDLRTDLSVYRPSDNNWYLQESTAGFYITPWGVSGDIITPGDFEGDGKTDTAIWRPSTGTWWVFYSSNRAIVTAQWGVAGDIPQSGDFDGDGKDDYVLWRPSNGTWYMRLSGPSSFVTKQWGVAGDVPVAGDYDGDGRDDVAVWRPSTGTWYRINSGNNQMVVQSWGVATDLPVNADYDADGKEDIAVFRPSNGTWYQLNSSNGNLVTNVWGQTGDIPVPGDYNGDGAHDRAVYRGGTWHLNPCIQGQTVRQFGLATDKAIPASDLP
jgi:hypothetical protein